MANGFPSCDTKNVRCFVGDLADLTAGGSNAEWKAAVLETAGSGWVGRDWQRPAGQPRYWVLSLPEFEEEERPARYARVGKDVCENVKHLVCVPLCDMEDEAMRAAAFRAVRKAGRRWVDLECLPNNGEWVLVAPKIINTDNVFYVSCMGTRVVEWVIGWTPTGFENGWFCSDWLADYTSVQQDAYAWAHSREQFKRHEAMRLLAAERERTQAFCGDVEDAAQSLVRLSKRRRVAGSKRARPDGAAAAVAAAAAAASAFVQEDEEEEVSDEEEVSSSSSDSDDDDDEEYPVRGRPFRSRGRSSVPATNLTSRLSCPSPPRNQVRSRVAIPTSPPPAPRRRQAARAARVVEVDDSTVFEVDKVRKVVYERDGSPRRFLISWKGFSRQEDSWVSARELLVPAGRFCEEHGFRRCLLPGDRQRVVCAGSRSGAAAAAPAGSA